MNPVRNHSVMYYTYTIKDKRGGRLDTEHTKHTPH